MKRFRKIWVLMLVLAYAGQAMASVAPPCQHMAPGAAAVDMAAEPAMAHAGHHMVADSNAVPAAPTADCCDDGLCAMSHCQSAAAAVPLNWPGGSGHFTLRYPRPFEIVSLLHPVDLLYRPPISR